MSWVTGFGTFLGAAITIVVSVAVYLHGTRKDKYQVDIALVSELRKKEPNRYLVERLFFELYRCSNVSYEEIIILMNHNRPSTAIKKFATVRRWSYVFKIKFENGTVRYDLCPGFEKKWKRFSKYCLVFVGFVFMYLMMMYFGNKFLITLIKEIDSYSHRGVGVADGFSGLFTVLILFLISAMTALFSILSVTIFMSAVSSIHNAKEIVRIHNEYPHE